MASGIGSSSRSEPPSRSSHQVNAASLRRWASRLAVRLFAALLVLVSVPLLGLYAYRAGSTSPEALRQSLLDQDAALLAAALAESGELVEEAARLILSHAGDQASRLQVLDRRGRVLADSLPGAVTNEAGEPAARVSIRSGGETVGTVVATSNQAAALRRRRWPRALECVSLEAIAALAVLAAIAAAAAGSWYLSRRIARPLEQLGREAEQLLDRSGRVRLQFSAAQRGDEIGDLARALEELSGRLDAHIQQAAAFATDLAHEVRNPLAAIRSAAEMLSEVAEPADRRRFAAIVEAESARLDALLHAARESAALDAQLDREPRAAIPLHAFLIELIERARPAATVPIELRAAPGSDQLLVFARPERLAQVFTNLLDNLISFSPPGAAVSVSLTPTSRTALVHLRDRGPGIPPEHLERVFERFFSYRPGERAAGHTGSGLAIVRAIVTAYGGAVRAENAADGGARFEVRLPRAEISDQPWRGDG